MKRKRRQRVVSIFMALLMIVGLIPTDFAVTTAKAADPVYIHTMDVSTMDSQFATYNVADAGSKTFSGTTDANVLCGTDNFFSLMTIGDKLKLYNKTSTPDKFGTISYNYRVQLDGALMANGKAGIKFTTTSAATVTVYASGKNATSKLACVPYVSTATASVTTPIAETGYALTQDTIAAYTFKLDAANTYVLGALTGARIYYVSVDETPAPVGTKSTISSVTSTLTGSTVDINWAATGGSGAATTTVEYSSDNGTTWKSVGDVNQDIKTKSHDLKDLASGTYLYRVTGDSTSVASSSSVVWVQPRADWTSAVVAPTATAVQSGADVKVTWTMNLGTNGADSLVVDLLDSNNAVISTDTIEKVVGTEKTTGELKLAASNTGTYTIRLTAKRADGTGTPEKVVASAATIDYAAALAQPTLVSSTGDGNGGVALVWDAVNEAGSYTISYKKASEADSAYVDSAAMSTTSYKVTGLTVGTEYTFKITATRTTPVYAAATSQVTFNKNITSTVERVWNTAYVGTQAGDNKEGGTVTANADGSVYMYAPAGKFASSNDGYAFYYTEVNSSSENFVLKATFNVTKIADNQSGVGLLVADTLGQVGQYELASETNYYLAGVSKTEFVIDGIKSTYSCGTNVRKVTGCTDPTGQNATGRVVDMTSAFQTNLETTQQVNPANIAAGTCQTSYTITLTKDNNGYYATMVGSDNVVHMYDANKLLKQDGEKVYVGLAVARGTEATFSDISFESRNPASDPVLDPSTWDKEYTPQNLFVFAGGTTGTSNYTYRYYGNWAGQFTLTDGNGNVLVSKYIEANETVTYDTQLVKGTTKFITTIEPDASKVTLVSYDPVVIEKSVTYKTYGNEGQTIVVSADGTSAGKGTDASPFDIYTAVKYAQPGQVIYLKNGTYFLTSAVTIPNSVNGTADNRITLMAQDAGQVILDGSQIPEFGGSILNVNGNYWRVYGLDLCNSSDNTKGMGVSGSNNIIEMCNIHDNGTTGLQISRSGGEPKEWWPSNNLIKNCTAYNNCDPLLNDADGFAAKLTVGEGNKFYGCIAYNNIDDGWDLYAKNEIGQGSIGAVIIENSVAYLNGYVPGIVGYGEGNGFKLGGEGLPGAHQLINSVSFNNGGKGIASNNGPDCQVINCTSYNNNFYYATGLNPAKGKSSPNLSLSPLNGSKYNGKTNYVLKNTISLYTFEVGVADDIVTVGGQPSLESDNTYLVKSVSSASGTQLSSGLAVTTSGTTFSVSPSYAALVLKSVNLSGTVLPADIFKSVNTTAVPTRNANGTISMNGLLEISAAYVSLGLGATIVTTGADAVSVAPAKTTVITGDTTHFYLFFTLSIMSGAALVGLFFYDKKKRAFVA